MCTRARGGETGRPRCPPAGPGASLRAPPLPGGPTPGKREAALDTQVCVIFGRPRRPADTQTSRAVACCSVWPCPGLPPLARTAVTGSVPALIERGLTLTRPVCEGPSSRRVPGAGSRLGLEQIPSGPQFPPRPRRRQTWWLEGRRDPRRKGRAVSSTSGSVLTHRATGRRE